MEISRRDFLRLLGISTAGVAAGSVGCNTIWSVPDEVVEKIGGAPRRESWKTSVCSLCPSGCGIKVRLIDGIPVRILGNSINPVNRNGLCPMGETGIEALFNPNRIKHPLKRVGSRGENKWEKVSWDEAIQSIVTRLQSLREKSEPHKMAFWSSQGNNLQSGLIEQFTTAFGSPNFFQFDDNNVAKLATRITLGHEKQLAYNFENIDLLINFGGDFLDAGPAPVRFNQIYAEIRNRENGQQAKIIHIDSRLSRTATNSDEFIAVKPGTMAALALGVANVLINDGQYDDEFIAKNSFGFFDWQSKEGKSFNGFKHFIEREYYPEKVAKITGVTASQIVDLARKLSAAKSALVLSGGQASASTNGLYTSWAIECLNALKGNFKENSPISLAPHPPFAEIQEVQMDGIATKGLARTGLSQAAGDFCFAEYSVSNIPDAISQQNPVEILFLANANPVFNAINQAGFTKALSEIPFIVSFSSFMDESNAFADLILPDHVYLEKHEIVHSIPMIDFAHFSVQQPVIEPLFDTRHPGDVIIQIAQKIGGTVASSLPWVGYKEYLQDRVKGIYETGTGLPFSEEGDEKWLKYLKERGWQIFEFTNFKEFWQVLLEKGGWWDPFPQQMDFNNVFATPSRKFEFFSQLLEKEIQSHVQTDAISSDNIAAVLAKLKIAAPGDMAFIPHYEIPHFDDGDGRFDLHLLPFNLITNVNGMGNNMPLAQEMFGMLTREYWNSWLEINPETAHEKGISEGDFVKVTSSRGSLTVRAKLLPTTMPGTICIPFGLGRINGATSKRVGVNPYSLLVEKYDHLRGIPSLISTKVSVKKANGREAV